MLPWLAPASSCARTSLVHVHESSGWPPRPLVSSRSPTGVTCDNECRSRLDDGTRPARRQNRVPPLPRTLPIAQQSGDERVAAARGVMQPSAIGAGDDCCDRGRSRSSRALWRRAARQAAPGAHDGSPTGCDSRAHGVAVTAGGPGIWASVRRTAADRRPRARGVAPPRRTQWQKRRGDLSRSRSQAVKRQPAFVCQRH